jgi:helicase
LYSTSELSRLTKRDKIIPKVETLRKRLKYGVKLELLPLVRVKNIGRVRARKLYNAGIINIEGIKKADPKKLSYLIGEKTTEKICEQLGIKFEKPKRGLEKYF